VAGGLPDDCHQPEGGLFKDEHCTGYVFPARVMVCRHVGLYRCDKKSSVLEKKRSRVKGDVYRVLDCPFQYSAHSPAKRPAGQIKKETLNF
jgi:hypothetical protein